LIAALGARENQQEAAIAAQLDQEKQRSSTAPNTTERDASDTERPDALAAGVSILPDKPETDLDTSKLMMLDKAGTTPKADKPANSDIPHIGIGVAKGSAKDGGLVILEVDLGSPAGRAGVRKHDLLLKVDGTPVSRPDQLREALLSLKGNHSIVLTIERQGKTQRNKLILH
jgi:membrane-associated protease RseP (regulator of RpoE activity)